MKGTKSQCYTLSLDPWLNQLKETTLIDPQFKSQDFWIDKVKKYYNKNRLELNQELIRYISRSNSLIKVLRLSIVHMCLYDEFSQRMVLDI